MTYCKLDPLNLGTTQPITGPTPFTQSTCFADPNLKRPYSDLEFRGAAGIVSFSSGALFDVGTGKDLADTGN